MKSYFKAEKTRLSGHGLQQLYQAVWVRDDYTCQNPECDHKQQLDRAPHHVRLKSQGGEDIMSNLITLCIKCHRKVHDHLIDTGFIKDYIDKLN